MASLDQKLSLTTAMITRSRAFYVSALDPSCPVNSEEPRYLSGEQALSALRRCFTGWQIHVDETIPAAATEERNGVLHELRSTLIKFVAQAPQ